MVVFVITTPFIAILVDKGAPRKAFIIGGVLLWTVAAAAGCLAVDYWTLLIPRFFVGIGEASCVTFTTFFLNI